MQLSHTSPMNDKPDDPREQAVRGRCEVVVMPLHVVRTRPIPQRADDPMEALQCSDVIARAVEKWGWQSVARSFKCELEASELHIDGVTLDELAEGIELLSTRKVQAMTDSIMGRIRQLVDDDAEGEECQ